VKDSRHFGFGHACLSLLFRDSIPDGLAAGRSSRFPDTEQLCRKTRIRRLFFCRSLNCLLHPVNNSVAFIVSRIDFPLLRWIIHAHFKRLSLAAFHPHTLWQGLSSIAQQKFVTGFGASAQYFKQLNNCRSWATICINQLFICAQLY
jgi:hypothetical protein